MEQERYKGLKSKIEWNQSPENVIFWLSLMGLGQIWQLPYHPSWPEQLKPTDSGRLEPRIGACGIGVGAWHRIRGEEEALWGSVENSGLIEIGTSQKRSLRWFEQKGSGSWGTASQALSSLRSVWWL